MNRYNLVLRKISGSGRAFKPDTVNVTLNYLKEVRELAKEYSDKEIFNFDETSYYMDAVGNVTIALKGSRKTYAMNTGHEKVRLSTLMCASASGHKLKIVAVVPRK